MSVGPVRSTPDVVAAPKPAAVPAKELATPKEKVSISPAAQKLAAGDQDHDGDAR